MLIEELFSKGVMVMGPSPRDSSRLVGTFPPELVQRLAATRARELEAFRWIAGNWNFENLVPATPVSPAYADCGSQTFALCEKESWVCMVAQDGRQHPYITFDPFSLQWIYVLTRGSYGILRSRQGWVDNQIVFSGLMTMIGVDCEWRMTCTRSGDNEFHFVNEERLADGSWSYIDQWRFTRGLS